MRRSAAPSFKADIKRARFLPQIMKTISSVDKENTSKSPGEINNMPNVPLTVIGAANENKRSPEKIRSNKDVLDIIFKADSTVSQTENSSEIDTLKEKQKTEKKVQSSLKINSPIVSLHSNSNELLNDKMSSCIFCIKDIEDAALFSVVWCKRSGKKHKTWEGDGLLVVRSRSAILKDLNGKILDRGVGYKLKETESLEEGSKFFIGGKECEIQYQIPNEECQKGKYCICNSPTNTQTPVKQPEKPVVPIPTNKPC